MWSGWALAQEASEAPDQTAVVEQLYLEGAALYKDRKYRPAIEKFNAAYAIYPEPNLLYNIGRAYEALGELEKAIESFKQCAAAEGTSEDVRTRAKAKVEQLEKAKMRSRLTAAEEPKPPKAAPAPKPSPSPALTAATTPEPSPVYAISAWTSAALAVGLAAGGGVMLALGIGDHNEVEDAKRNAGGGPTNLTQIQAQALIDDGSQKKMIGGILLGAGGAAAVAAVTFFILDAKQAPSVGVSVSGSAASVSLGGRF